MLDENEDSELIDLYKPIPNCTEIESPIYLSRDDIFELGFLRSNPQFKVYQHKDNSNLILEEVFGIDYSVKDRVTKTVVVYKKEIVGTGTLTTYLYKSQKPDIEDIKRIIGEQ